MCRAPERLHQRGRSRPGHAVLGIAAQQRTAVSFELQAGFSAHGVQLPAGPAVVVVTCTGRQVPRLPRRRAARRPLGLMWSAG